MQSLCHLVKTFGLEEFVIVVCSGEIGQIISICSRQQRLHKLKNFAPHHAVVLPAPVALVRGHLHVILVIVTAGCLLMVPRHLSLPCPLLSSSSEQMLGQMPGQALGLIRIVSIKWKSMMKT